MKTTFCAGFFFEPIVRCERNAQGRLQSDLSSSTFGNEQWSMKTVTLLGFQSVF